MLGKHSTSELLPSPTPLFLFFFVFFLFFVALGMGFPVSLSYAPSSCFKVLKHMT
jgi:hypothetical protein